MTFSCKPLNTVTSKQLFTLLRALWHETPSDDFIHDLSADSWQKIYKVATSQGVLAIAWDGLEQLIAEGLIPQERQPPLQLKIQWAYNVEQIEKRSAEQVRVLSELTAFYHKHGIPTMLLKGYGVAWITLFRLIVPAEISTYGFSGSKSMQTPCCIGKKARRSI